MSAGLRISFTPSELVELQMTLEGALHEFERFQAVYAESFDPVDGGNADVLDRLWARFWHAHGTISGVADQLESMNAEIPKDLSTERATT